MNRAIFITGLAIGAFAIAACGNKDKIEREGPLALSESELGPNTEDLVKQLPDGLVGDKENARYSNRDQRGEDEDGK